MYKKRGESRTFIAIAEWESFKARQAAMKEISEGKTDRAKRVRNWGANEDYGKVTVLSELDEIDQVLP